MTAAATGAGTTGTERLRALVQLGEPAPAAVERAPAPPCTGVPAALGAAIDACLAHDPDDRPSLPQLAALLAPLAPGARPWDA
jgi:hypothetical protein